MDYFNPNTEPNYTPSAPNPKEQPPKPKKTKEELLGTKTSKVSGGSKFVACLMSFILGIVGTVGGVVGAGYWAVTQPISTVSDTISGIFGADFDYTEFIDESYGDKQALDLLSDTWSAIASLSEPTASLEKFAKITPKVNELVTSVQDTVSQVGITVTEEELLTTPFPQFVDFLKERLNESPVGDILMSFGMESPILMTICYGEEGVDYDLVDGKVVMREGSEQLLVEDLLGDDITSLFNKIPLDVMLSDQEISDVSPILMALCYGEEGKDYIIEDGEVVMQGGSEKTKLGDLLDDDMMALFTDMPLDILVADKEFNEISPLLLALCYGEEGVDYDVIDDEVVMKDGKEKTKLGDLLEDDVMDLFTDMPLDILIADKELNEVSPLLLALCYGEEGKDYIIGEDNKINMINDSQKTMLKDLLDSNTDALLEKVPLDVLIIKNEDGEIPALHMAICYGEEGVDYVVDDDGNVTMLGDSEKTKLSDLLSDDITDTMHKIPLAALLTDMDPNNPDDDMMFAIAYGTKGETFQIVEDSSEKGYHVEMLQVAYYKTATGFADYEHVEIELESFTEISGINGYTIVLNKGLDEDNNPILETQHVVFDVESGRYLAYKTLDSETKAVSDPIYYKQTLVGQLTSDFMPLLEHLYLKDILNINANSNKVLRNLGFGIEGLDYMIHDGKIVMLGDALPHTIGYLKEHKDDLIDSIHLSDVISPQYDSGIIMYMLYGTEGLHYEIIGEGAGRYVKMLPAFIYVREGLVYDEQEYLLDADTYVLDGNQYTYQEHTYTLVRSETVGEEDKYYLYLGESQVSFETTRLGDLHGEHNPLVDFQDSLTLEDVLGAESLEDNVIFSTLADCKISQLPQKATELKVKDVFENYADNALLKSLGEEKLLDVPNKVTELTVKDVFENYDSNALLKNLGEEKLLDLPNKVTELKVEDVFDNYDSNALLKNLGGEKLLDLPNKIVDLKVSDIFEESDFLNNSILNSIAGEKLTDIPSAIVDLTLEEALGDQITHVNGVPTGTWKYLLYNEGDDFDHDKADKSDYNWDLHILTSMNQLVTNMMNNIHSATLNELTADGIISGLDSVLNNPLQVVINIKFNTPFGTYSSPVGIGISTEIAAKIYAKNGTTDNVIPAGSDKEALTIGELTIDEMLSYLASIFDLFTNLSNGISPL